MAIPKQLGGIKINDYQVTMVLPWKELLPLVVSGLAFEQDAAGSGYEHLSKRAAELAPARSRIQRSFYRKQQKTKRRKNLETGETESVTEIGWGRTRKYENARGDLRKYIEGPYVDSPENAAAGMPSIVLFFPEHLKSKPANVDVGMGGEFELYDFSGIGPGMALDGETRCLSVDLAIRGDAINGDRKQALMDKLVTVEIHHGRPVVEMAQVFADLNGKGIKLNSNEVASRDMRDPWAIATREIFDELGTPLVLEGRQVSRTTLAEGQHLVFTQAVKMVRAMALGTVSKAESKSAIYDEGILWEHLQTAGVEWFGQVLEHFASGRKDRNSVFSDDSLVLRSSPVKIAIGALGHPWYDTDMEKRVVALNVLKDVNWNVGRRWDGIAGKVTEMADGEYRLANAGVKEIGGKVVSALTDPSVQRYKSVRGRK